MELHFTKMHGLGNDYIYVNCIRQPVKNPPEIAKQLSDRHFGIGADGLVLIESSEQGDFQMRVFSADGSEENMCGNAIRCVGKYVYERGLTDQTALLIETRSGPKKLHLSVEGDKVSSVEVDMGEASIRARDIPVETEYDEFISQPMLVHGEVYLVSCISMGNPHAVIFCEDVAHIDLEVIGPLFERHENFPQRINTEFVQLIDRNTIRMRVWERGNGETFACGTGACASVVAAVINGHCDYDTEVTVRLLGGELKIIYHNDHTVTMKGPATHVFDGVANIGL